MLKNTIITVITLILIGLINIVIDDDVIYSLWCVTTCVIGMFLFKKIKKFANWVVG